MSNTAHKIETESAFIIIALLSGVGIFAGLIGAGLGFILVGVGFAPWWVPIPFVLLGLGSVLVMYWLVH